MEGPSLVIACEEFSQFLNLPVKKAVGTVKFPVGKLKGQKLLAARSWGKHFLLVFEKVELRIHFLMFGSYRINDPRKNRIPKMQLTFGKDEVYFYSCAIKPLEESIEELYDWSIDTMAKEWNGRKALAVLRSRPDDLVCDILMNQDIFAGVGNIMKNEILYYEFLHPEVRVGDLPDDRQAALVKRARLYSKQFYKWKKANVLKRNWQVFRKKICPRCDIPVIKRPTGKLERISHYCESCQKRLE